MTDDRGQRTEVREKRFGILDMGVRILSVSARGLGNYGIFALIP
jgi:hypothetical protein